ncbi:globin domain-containing protein [Aerosakkonema funiforme]|uniref:globin domain-containing protein n=1 Tax=Aerosakkonema funiforme TaxID=1246630 RepID=UPI0035B890C2
MSLKVELLEQSFQRIKPHAEEFAASFYENLFAANPRVKPLFAHSDIKKQQGKLLSALVLVVESLRKPEVLKEVLKDLGSRHVSYGAIPKYYPLVGAVLLATFEQYLQEDWTPEVKQAWVDAYSAIAALMFEGAGYPAQTLELETVTILSPAPHKSTTAIKEVAASVTPLPPQQKLSIASTDEKKTAIGQRSSGEMLKDAASAAPPPLIEKQAIAFVGENKAPIVQKSTTNVNEFTANVAPPPPQKSGALQVELLESSFAKIKPQAEQFAASFYENLFAANPRVKTLFAHSDMKKQQGKLLAALVLVIESLRKPEVLKAVLKDLGARHVSYGAIPKYYPLVGSALVTTLAQYLQSDWTEEVKQAWVDAYSAIAALMFEGAGYPAETLQLETLPIPSAGEQKPPTPQESTTSISKSTASTTSSVLEKAPALTPSPVLEKAPTPQKSGALQVELLESSFAKIKPQLPEFVVSFYDNLFAANPGVKPLFAHIDMKKQHKKLLSALVLVVESLRKPEALRQVLQDLGSRHVAYGALPIYYPPVVSALLVTLEQYLQQDWTPEVKVAWENAFATIANVMLSGAGYAAPSLPSPPVPTFSNDTVTVPVTEKSPVFQNELINNKFTLLKTQAQEHIKRLTSVVKEGVTTEQIQEKLTVSQETLVKWFWELPTWAIASFAALILISLVLISDENSPLAKILGSADAISVLLALILFIKEIPERRKQSHYQAWSIIDGAEGVEVSYARLMALQDLNRDRVSLRGVKVAGAKLENIDLSEAELTEADMSNADLDEANFTRANLNRANLSFASLTRVNFSRANMSFAKLKGARMAGSNFKNANLLGADLSNALLTGVDLKGANLSAANLKDANLSGANLEDTTLTGANLEGAIMPDGFQEG